jgi:2-polyprenyl-3-methyl-5-hydroxy-6-metoxy-1,4-benzoquinol methylase
MTCPLCKTSKDFAHVNGPDNRVFQHCDTCQVIFAAPHMLPSLEEERSHYLRHENSIENEGYVNFLNKAIQPALPFFEQGWRGLDYGCGPGPTLSQLVAKAGYEVVNYDPFFFPKLKVKQVYDFIFATECFEHFFHPAKELELLQKLLKVQGLLIIKTQHWQNLSELATWYYAKDVTHVVFYHSQTFNWIAEHYGFEKIYSDNSSVIILKKIKHS